MYRYLENDNLVGVANRYIATWFPDITPRNASARIVMRTDNRRTYQIFGREIRCGA
jgi:hypothetical protein